MLRNDRLWLKDTVEACDLPVWLRAERHIVCIYIYTFLFTLTFSLGDQACHRHCQNWWTEWKSALQVGQGRPSLLGNCTCNLCCCRCCCCCCCYFQPVPSHCTFGSNLYLNFYSSLLISFNLGSLYCISTVLLWQSMCIISYYNCLSI